MNRRLPVYVLLDCSESVIGAGLAGLQRGLDSMLRALRQNPHALETAWLSFITFDNKAEVKVPLTALEDIQVPQLKVRPGTALGAALRLLGQQIQSEVQRASPGGHKGDYRPMVILITDGQATDDWRSGKAELDATAKISNLYAIGCGDDIDWGALRDLTDIVLNLPEMTEAGFAKLFVWITDTVGTASMGVSDDPAGQRDAMLAKLPKEVQKVDVVPRAYENGQPRQVFLFATCGRMRKPYLMRYRLNEVYHIYTPVAAHKLEPETAELGDRDIPAPNISSSQLDGCPPCPWCGDPGAGSCGMCGTVFCGGARQNNGLTICPGCGNTLRPGGGGEFDVRQSVG